MKKKSHDIGVEILYMGLSSTLTVPIITMTIPFGLHNHLVVETLVVETHLTYTITRLVVVEYRTPGSIVIPT